MNLYIRIVAIATLTGFLLLGNSLFIKATNEVTFSIRQPQAKKVKVYGSFNGWARGYELKKVDGERWQQTVELARGRYEYKFLIDGKWEFDAGLPAINDGLYSKNNVIVVR